MSDDEYDDELPPIVVDFSHSDSFVELPPASQLASERARDEDTERRAQALIHRPSEDKDPDLGDTAVARLHHSSSSSSEGEGVLSASLQSLVVASSVSAAARVSPGSLLRLLCPGDEPHITQVAELLDSEDESLLRAYTYKLGRHLCEVSQEGSVEAVCLGLSSLCGLRSKAMVGRGQAQTRAALIHVLDNVCGEEQISSLCSWVPLAAERASGARAASGAALLLALADAVRSSAGKGADRLSAALLLKATQADPHQLGPSSMDSAYIISAEGRRLRDGQGSQESLLKAKALANAATLHRMKMGVSAARLQLLFAQTHSCRN